MRNFARFMSKQLSFLVPEKYLYNTSAPFFLPFYHTVSNNSLTHILNYPYRNTVQFEKELDFFLKYFKPVSLGYLLKNQVSKEKVFHLSFDDGLKECSEIIAPILLKKGIPATFFVNSGFVDNKALFHKYKASLILSTLEAGPNKKAELFLKSCDIDKPNLLQTDLFQVDILNEAANILGINFQEFLKTETPYLTKKQILILKENGFSVGAHSENHPEFWKLSEEEQFNEVKQSIDWLIDNINPRIKAFSFPFTDSGISTSLLKKLKASNVCDITFGTSGLKFDEFDTHLQRYPVEQKGNFKQNMKTEWIYFKLRKAIGKATVKH